jgi:transaldolase
VGRLDDRRENGMDLIANILKMYLRQDSHVEVLTASVRNYDHFMCALKLGSDIITAPFSIFKEWGERGLPIPDNSYVYNAKGKQGISFGEIDLKGKWQDFAIRHELTDKGVEFFCRDWNSLIR